MKLTKLFKLNLLLFAVTLNLAACLEQEIVLQRETTKDITGCDPIDFHIKNLTFTQSDKYLIIKTTSQDDSLTTGKLYSRFNGYASDKTQAELFGVDEGDNLIFIAKDYAGPLTEFYLYLELSTKSGNSTCQTKLTFEYADIIPVMKNKEYQFVSAPTTYANEDHFKIDGITVNDFPMLLYIVAPNDYATQGSTATLINGDKTYNIEMEGFLGGLIAILNDTSMVSGDATKSLDIKFYSTPTNLITIGTRKHGTSVPIKVGQRMVYSFLPTPTSNECYTFEASENQTYTINIVPFRKNLKVKDEGTGLFISEDLDYPQSFKFTLRAAETSRMFCFSPSDADQTIYAFQIEDFSRQTPQTNALKDPLYNGLVYTMYGEEGKITYYRHYGREYYVDALTNMNVKELNGKLSVHKIVCETFPDCTDLESGTFLHEINGFFTTSFSIYKEPSVLSAKQTLLAVKCLSATCDYEVSFYSDYDVLEIRKDHIYNQFMINSESDEYSIRNEDKTAEKIVIKFTPITGDSFMEMFPSSFLNLKQIFVGTSWMYEITAKEEYAELKPLVGEFHFIVRAARRAYYSVYYETRSNNLQANEIVVPTGIYTIESIEAKTEVKNHFIVKNRERKALKPLGTGFFPVNCKVEIKRLKEDGTTVALDELDGMFQDSITFADSEYDRDHYTYEVAFVEFNQKTVFNGERCNIYVGSLEEGNPIVLGENHFLQNYFTKEFKEIDYLVPFTNIGNDFIGHLVLENEVPIEIEVRIDDQTVTQPTTTKRNLPLILTKDKIRESGCTEYICNILFKIKLSQKGESFLTSSKVRFDFLGRTEEYAPSYLKKRLVREEIMLGDDPYYFITDISKYEEGEINLNFNKGNGVLSAKIVQKNYTDYKEPKWQARYNFPDPFTGDSLVYDPFTQSIKYTTKETEKCEDGCDLLIGVYPRDIMDYDPNPGRVFLKDFSIFVKSTNDDTELGGIVDVPANEYITGHLEKLNTGKNKRDVYTFTVHNNAKTIFIELQGEIIDLYGNWDTNKIPTDKEDCEVKCFALGEDRICEITTTEWSTFLGHTLTFVVASDLKDTTSDLNAYYMFKFRTPSSGFETMNIYELNSDHGIKCDYQTGRPCHFLFPLRNYKVSTQLVVAVEGEILSDFEIYGRTIKGNNYEILSASELEAVLPTKSLSEFDSASNFWTNYIIIDNIITEDNYILLTVYSQRPGLLTVMNTYKQNIRQTRPKSQTQQLFRLYSDGIDIKDLNMDLPSDRNYEMYFKVVSGIFIVYANDEDNKQFTVTGNGDSVIINFNEQPSESQLNTNVQIIPVGGDCIFFVDYRPRAQNDILTLVRFGSSTEISYDELGFPLNLYSKIPNNIVENDIVVNVKFRGQHESFSEDLLDNFIVSGVVCDYKEIQKRQKDKTKRPAGEWKTGTYSPYLRTGMIPLVNEDEISNPDYVGKYVYIEMNQTNTVEKYTDIHLEVSIIPLSEKRNVVPSEQYHHAFLLDNQMDVNYHIIKRNFEEDPYMMFEFSSIDANVDFALNAFTDSINETQERTNDTENIFKYLLSKKEKGGTVSLLFKFIEAVGEDEYENVFPEKVLLTVFTKNQAQFKSEETNYVYKAETSPDLILMPELTDDELKYVYYTDKEMDLMPYQPSVNLGDNDISIPSDYYVVMLPKDEAQDLSHISIALKPIKYHSIFFYDTEDIHRTIKFRMDKFPEDKVDTMALFAITDYDYDLFMYQVAYNCTKDPQKKKDFEEIIMNDTYAEYVVENNEDKYFMYFNVSLTEAYEKMEDDYFEIVVTPKKKTTGENDLYMSATKLYVDREKADLISDEHEINRIVVPKEMIKVTKKIYLTVICDDLCDFKMQITNGRGASIHPGDTYSHLFTGTQNLEIPIYIGERPPLSPIQAEQDDLTFNNETKPHEYLTVYFYGGSGDMGEILTYYPAPNVSNVQSENIKMNRFYNGYVVTLPLKQYPLENGAYFKITAFCFYGLATIGARYTNDDTYYGTIDLFHNEIRGYLMEGVDEDCYPLNGIPSEGNQIEVNVLTDRQVNVYLRNGVSDEKIEYTDRKVVYQDSLVYNYEEHLKICFERIDKNKPCAFAFQTIQNEEFMTRDSAKIASKINGVVYRQNLDMKRITYYRHSKYKTGLGQNENAFENTINFNLRVIDGNPKFYIDHCESYPDCYYDDDVIAQRVAEGKMVKPTRVGDFYTGAVDTALEKHELYPDQYLIVVSCTDSPKDCLYEVSFFDEKDRLTLREGSTYQQFMNVNDEDKFQINVIDDQVKKIEIRLNILSGSAYLTDIWPDKEVEGIANYTEDFGTNEIRILQKDAGHMQGNYQFTVKSDNVAKNAYYLITVYFRRYDNNEYTELPRGVIVADSFPYEKGSPIGHMIAYEHNFRNGEQGLWSLKLLSINCDLEVAVVGTGGEDKYRTTCIDGFCNLDLDETMEEFSSSLIRYRVYATRKIGDDGDQKCKYFAATEEQSTEFQLVYGQNSPFKLMFSEKVQTHKIVYPFSNVKDSLILKLILEDESHLEIKAAIKEKELKQTAMKSRAVVFTDFRKQCYSPEEPCIAEYTIHASNKEEAMAGFAMEFSIKSDSSIPSYLPRRKLREEYVHFDDTQFYVSDIADNEKGMIQLHFNRGKGKIFAKIVPKGTIEQGGEYKGRVILPTLDSPDSLQMDPFTNQIMYDSSKYDCTKSHCELYIGVYDTQYYVGGTANLYLNDYSIFVTDTANDAETFKGVVDVPVNEYIVGNLDQTVDKGRYDYYIFNVPTKVKKFYIEFYTEACDIYIKEGTDSMPSKDNYDYKKENDGKPALIQIDSKTGEYIKNKFYYIAVASDKLDQVVSARYMLRFVTVERDFLFFQEMNSDESILSQIVEEEDTYAHFIMPLRDYDLAPGMEMYLYTYARNTTDFGIYVDFITEDQYANLDAEGMKRTWPSKDDCALGTKDQINSNYLHIDYSLFKQEKLMLISVYVPKGEQFYLTSTFRLNVDNVLIQPFSTQTVVVDFTHPVTLDYPDNHDYLLHATVIAGSGTITFGDKPYDFKGIHGTVIITINKNEKTTTQKTIKLQNDDDDNSFDVLLEYNIRPEFENFDEVRYGENGAIVINGDDLPLYFYAKVYKPEDLTFSFKFNDVKLAGEQIDPVYDLVVDGGYIEYDEVILKRNDHTHSLDTVDTAAGLIDLGGMGMLNLPKEFYEEFYSELKNPYFYIKIDKQRHSPNNTYDYIHLDFSFIPSNNIEIPSPIGQYAFSYMPENKDYSWFRLRKEKKGDKRLLLQFGSAYKKLGFALTDTKPGAPFFENTTKFDDYAPNGRKDMLIANFSTKNTSDSIYLAVFRKNKNNLEDDEGYNNLQFAFRYSTGEYVYPMKNPDGISDIHFTESNELFVKLKKPVLYGSPAQCRYTVKLIKTKDLNKDLTLESIAPVNAKLDFIDSYLDKDDEKKEFEYKFKLPKDFKIAEKDDYTCEIIANVLLNDELVSYGAYVFGGKKKDDDDDSSPKWWIIVVIIAAAAILIACGILLSKYLKAKKDTEGAMMKTSFIGNNLVPGGDEEENNNILK